MATTFTSLPQLARQLLPTDAKLSVPLLLSRDIVFLILDYLPLHTYSILAQVNKYFYQLLHSTPIGYWNQLLGKYKLRIPSFGWRLSFPSLQKLKTQLSIFETVAKTIYSFPPSLSLHLAAGIICSKLCNKTDQGLLKTAFNQLILAGNSNIQTLRQQLKQNPLYLANKLNETDTALFALLLRFPRKCDEVFINVPHQQPVPFYQDQLCQQSLAFVFKLKTQKNLVLICTTTKKLHFPDKTGRFTLKPKYSYTLQFYEGSFLHLREYWYLTRGVLAGLNQQNTLVYANNETVLDMDGLMDQAPLVQKITCEYAIAENAILPNLKELSLVAFLGKGYYIKNVGESTSVIGCGSYTSFPSNRGLQKLAECCGELESLELRLPRVIWTEHKPASCCSYKRFEICKSVLSCVKKFFPCLKKLVVESVLAAGDNMLPKPVKLQYCY